MENNILLNVNKKELKKVKEIEEGFIAIKLGWLRVYNVGFTIPKNINEKKELKVVFIKDFEDIFKDKKFKYLNYKEIEDGKNKRLVNTFILELEEPLNKQEECKILEHFK